MATQSKRKKFLSSRVVIPARLMISVPTKAEDTDDIIIQRAVERLQSMWDDAEGFDVICDNSSGTDFLESENPRLYLVDGVDGGVNTEGADVIDTEEVDEPIVYDEQ